MLIPLEHGKPIRFGADGEHGVASDGQGRLRIVEVADVGEDALARPRRAAAEPEPGLRAVATRHRAARADADRRLPGRRATRLRQPGRPAAPRGADSARGRATSSALLRSGATWSLRVRATGRSGLERPEGHAGAGLGLEERASSGGMRRPPWATRSIWLTGHGPEQERGVGPTLAHRRDRLVPARLVGELVVAERWQAPPSAGSSRGRPRRPLPGPPAGRGARSASLVRRPITPAGAVGGEADEVGRRRLDPEERGEQVRAAARARHPVTSRWIGPDRELLFGAARRRKRA